MITLLDISKVYQMGARELPVLKDINLHIESGEMVAIMGPSGSGKSTLMNIIGLLDRPTAGNYKLDGKKVSELGRRELSSVRGRQIGFIFQSYNLLPRLTALANVELGLKYAGYDDYRPARTALDVVGLTDRMKHRPVEMSGGEQQRVAIARALAKKPAVVLADEPTGNLDSKSGEDIMSIIINLHQEQQITTVIITHDYDVAHRCRRIIHLKDGSIDREEIL